MDALSGIASVTQLAVYTHSAWKAFTRLYIELKGGPSLWQEHITNLSHIRRVVERISAISQDKHLDSAAQITELLRELTGIAENALNIIERTKKTVFGVRWSAIGATALLAGVFESLKAKREILLLVLSHENLVELSSFAAVASRIQDRKKGSKMSIQAVQKKAEPDANANVTIELSASQSGSGSTMISNNGLAQILPYVNGPLRIEAKSTGDRAVMNSNNATMDANVVKQQLDIAEIYARAYTKGNMLEDDQKRDNPHTLHVEGDAEYEPHTPDSTRYDRRTQDCDMDNDSACDISSPRGDEPKLGWSNSGCSSSD